MAGNPPDGGALYGEVTENGLSVPLDFSTTSPSSSSEDQQPVNLSDRLLPAGSSPLSSYPADPNRKYPIKTDYTSKVRCPTVLWDLNFIQRLQEFFPFLLFGATSGVLTC